MSFTTYLQCIKSFWRAIEELLMNFFKNLEEPRKSLAFNLAFNELSKSFHRASTASNENSMSFWRAFAVVWTLCTVCTFTLAFTVPKYDHLSEPICANFGEPPFCSSNRKNLKEFQSVSKSFYKIFSINPHDKTNKRAPFRKGWKLIPLTLAVWWLFMVMVMMMMLLLVLNDNFTSQHGWWR